MFHLSIPGRVAHAILYRPEYFQSDPRSKARKNAFLNQIGSQFR